jgi:hypothetical protein
MTKTTQAIRKARPTSRLGGLLALALAPIILVAPLWLWADPLDGYSPTAEGLSGLFARLTPLADPFSEARLQLDDFDYVAKVRTPADLSRHLLTPHNTHLMPLFRLWTYLWVQASTTLSGVPESLALASYLSYVMAMLLVGHVAAWETGRPGLGLAAMVFFGTSAILAQTIAWFAASQAVCAGVAVLAMLAALQRWRARGGRRWLALAAFAAFAPPLLWSGGYVAGPVGFAYLWADGRPHARKAALVPMLTSIAVAAIALMLVGRQITAAGNFHDRTFRQAADPVQGLVSTAQGVVEILLLRNLGLKAETSPAQAAVLCLLLAGLWAWTRGRPPRLNPLEAAGAVMALLGFAIVYTARGYFTFDSLRDLSWYQAIPQMGATLFAAGWWVGRLDGPPPRALCVPRPRGLVAVPVFMLVALLLQTPRVRARLVAEAYPLTASERERFPTPRLQRLRARYLNTEQAAWQRRFLAWLDRAEATARELSMGRAVIRRALGPVLGPGMPTNIPQIDGVNLLALPESEGRADLERVRSTLLPILTPEPEPRPSWLRPDEPWPPKTGP